MTVTPQRRRVRRLSLSSGTAWRTDELAVEEPLEVKVNGQALTITMRTPGADFDLVLGFLIGEGLASDAGEVVSMRTCPESGAGAGAHNVVEVILRHPVPREAARRFPTTSACGLCGAASIETVRRRARHDVRADALVVPASVLAGLPGRLRSAQDGFDRTGGLHAAGLFTAAGELLCVREDVGRHNAVDKLIGWAATRRRLPLTSHLLLVSGRASFELAQKALTAGIPLLAAVSAPSGLAASLADAAGMTLVGFLRGDHMNVYTGQARVTLAPDGAAVPG